MKHMSAHQLVKPIDVRALFGQLYRLDRDLCHALEYGEKSAVHDPWLIILLCRHGHIFPWGGDRLAASSNTAGKIANALTRLPCGRVEQSGADGVTVSFALADFPAVAAIMRPRRRRTLSGRHRKTLIDAGRRYRYGA